MQPTILEDLVMGGTAGACAAATTTPLDVVKTRMMCTASQRPTFVKVGNVSRVCSGVWQLVLAAEVFAVSCL